MTTAVKTAEREWAKMGTEYHFSEGTDVYFSADVETDGPIPGPFSILSFALVFAGSFDGERFSRPRDYHCSYYVEMRPISNRFDLGALRVNRLDRRRLCSEGTVPAVAMENASRWIRRVCGLGTPVLVAYPLSYDWSWLYWYFVRFTKEGSPFRYSNCFDIKTAVAVKGHIRIPEAGRQRLFSFLRSNREHTHNALDDATEQAEIFANVFEWKGPN